MTSPAAFNQIRAQFMRRASAPNVPPHALKLAYVIAFKYMNRETQTARPAQETLARDLNVDGRSIRRLLDILQPLGLTVIPGNGRGLASTYWIDPDKAKEKRTPESTFSGGKGGHQSPPLRQKGGLQKQKRRTPETAKGGLQSPPNLTKRTKKGTKKRERTLSPDDAALGKAKESRGREDSKQLPAKLEPQAELVAPAEDAFLRFWAVYPRKVEQDDARAAFAKAIEGGADSEAMIARVTCYALERGAAIAGGDDPKFTLHAATWLKKKKWNDPYPLGVSHDELGNVVAIEHEDESEEDSVLKRALRMGREAGVKW